MNLTFNSLREEFQRKREQDRATASGEAHPVAKIVGYGVASAAIFALATFYASVMSAAFQDPSARVLSVISAYIVGMSAVVFLVCKNQLLVGKWQYRVACLFVGLEVVLLTIGSSYVLGQALNWQFQSGYVELTHLAIIATLPTVAAEWLTVFALDPKAALERDENFNLSEQRKGDAEYRNTVKNSDAARSIRDAAILEEVLNEELSRLPSDRRQSFLSALKTQGYDVGDVPILGHGLPDVIDNGDGVKVEAPHKNGKVKESDLAGLGSVPKG